MISSLGDFRAFSRVLRLASFLGLTGFFASGGSALAQSCSFPAADSWTLGASGAWSVPGAWSRGVSPDSPGLDVCVTDGSSTVTLDVNATVGNAQVAQGNAIVMAPGTTLNVAGPDIVNSGQIAVDAGAGRNTVLSIGDTVSLTGGVLPTGVTFSRISLNSGGGGSAYLRGAGQTLNNVDNTIEGAGAVGDDGLNVVNGTVGLGGDGPGLIDANSPGGTLSIGSGGGSFVNAWGVIVRSGSTLEVSANAKGFDQVGGFTWAAGNLIVPHGFINEPTTHGVLNGQGLIAGHGTITGNVVNAGILDPEYFSGPGVLTIAGDYTQLDGGDFYVSIGQVNSLQVEGAASLSGVLDLFGPEGVQKIMSFERYSGNFSALDYNGGACVATGADVWTCGGFYRATEIFGPTGLTLALTGIPEPSARAMTLAGLAGLGFVGVGRLLKGGARRATA